MARKWKYPPVHPGKILKKEFLEFLGLSQNRLAEGLGVPPRRVNEIVLGKRGITADTALRLAAFFGNNVHFWMELQSRYEVAWQKKKLGERLENEVIPFLMMGPDIFS